ncbi:MAG TPA: cytochrome c [Rhodothermales bacterium]|nr:cytochrome c [Rhodothermales bacterium]
MFIRHHKIGLIIAVILVGCEHADPIDEGGLDPTLSSIQTNIFNTSCAMSGCHAGGGAGLPESMDLRAGQAFSNIVGVSSQQRPALNRVEPGDPDASYLVRKIEGGPDISGQRMPAGGFELTQEQIDVIREWISDGAEEN